MELLKPEEVAAELRVDRETVARMIRAKTLPAINIGSGARPSWRVERAELVAFVAARRALAEAAP